MLEIKVPIVPEQWDETTEVFIPEKTVTLRLEHSLVSISKWESTWGIPFLSDDEKSDESMLDYFKCMTLSQNVDPDVYNHLTPNNIDEIKRYIQAPMSASKPPAKPKTGPKVRRTITSELIYCWMIQLHIPVEFEKWHLNRLIRLIDVCRDENEPPKKMSKQEIMKRNRELNEARKKKLNTKG